MAVKDLIRYRFRRSVALSCQRVLRFPGDRRMAGEREGPAVRPGDQVWVLGTVRHVYGAEGRAEIAFAEWWPPWSSVLAPLSNCRVATADEPVGATNGKD